MSYQFPLYHAPDFSQPLFSGAPDAKWSPAEKDGVASEGFHSTSMYPEYFKINGEWRIAEESRMDASVVLRDDGTLSVVENRNLKAGDRVILGRTENGEEGIYMHCCGFEEPGEALKDQFVFRQGRSRETSYARDYDRLINLLRYEKEHGNILWVMGPAFAFDEDARRAMQAMIENGYAHGLMAGNALATHDLEAALLHTALGQDIYTQKSRPNGHYNHLDIINKVRRSGSIPQFIDDYQIDNGIIYSISKHDIPLDRRRQHDAVLPGAPGRRHTSAVFVLRGRRRICGQQAARPGQSVRHHHRHKRAGFHYHRGKRTGSDKIEPRPRTPRDKQRRIGGAP